MVFVVSFVWPRLGSPFRSGTSRGVCAKVVFVAFFVWPRLRAQLRGEIRYGGSGCVVIECGGRGRGR